MTKTVENSSINDNVKQNNKKIDAKKVNWFLNSNWALLTITLIVAFCWLIDVPIISITFILIFECLVFFYCNDNPKAFLYPILTIFFCPRSMMNTATMIYGIVLIAMFIAVVTAYIIIKIKKENFKCKKGKLFWFFIPLIIGNFLGGAVGNFNIAISLVAVVLLIILYLVYWFCLNFVKKSQKYYAYCAIFLAILITIEIFLNYFFTGNFFEAIIKKVDYFGIVHVNCASILMLTGLCSCFYLATGNKKDYLYILLAVFFDLIIFQNYSRITTFLAGLISIVYFIIIVRKSPNKKEILKALGVFVAVVLVLCAIMWKQVYHILEEYIELNFNLNGRNSLWTWCVKSFKENFFFGVGFTTSDPYVLDGYVAGMDIHGTFAFVHAHNFFLHHLTCIGLIGSILTIPFYIQKYWILFKNFTTYKLYLLLMYIVLFGSSLVDPTYTSDFFLILFCLAIFALAENISFNDAIDEKDEELKLSLALESVSSVSNKENTSSKNLDNTKNDNYLKANNINKPLNSNETIIEETNKSKNNASENNDITAINKSKNKSSQIKNNEKETMANKSSKNKKAKVTNNAIIENKEKGSSTKNKTTKK